MRIRRLSLSVASLLLIAAFSADAQPPVSTSARVVRATAVLEQPLGDARSVGTVVIGEILDVLDERNGCTQDVVGLARLRIVARELLSVFRIELSNDYVTFSVR